MTNESERQMDKKAGLPWGFWGTTILSSVIILVYFIIQLAVVVLMADSSGIDTFLKGGMDFSNGFVLSISIIVSAPVCILLTLLFIKIRRGIEVKDYLGLRMPMRREFLKWICFVAILMACFDLFSWIIHRPLIPTLMVDAYRTAHFIPAFLAAIILIGPVFEEVIFRGFVFKGIRYSRLGAIGALWFTAFFWSIMHLQYDLYGMVNVLALGLLFGAARLKTGSTYIAIIMHGLNNLVSTVEILLYVHYFG